MKNIIYLCFFTLFTTCCKEPILEPVKPIPTEITELKVLWQIPLGDDSTSYSSIDCELIGDGILYSRNSYEFSQNETLKFVDKNDGSLIWEWDNEVSRISDHQIINHEIVVINSWSDNYGVDLSTGQTIWEADFGIGSPRISSFGNIVFHNSSYGEDAPESDSSNIRYCHAEEGNWKDIIKFYKIDDYEVNLDPPLAYVDNEGDTILIFKNIQLIITPYAIKADLYSYNMTKDSILWKIENIDPSGFANRKPALIDGDYIYHVGKRVIYCLDKDTGEIVWEWGFPNESFGFLAVDFIIHNNKFIIPRNNGDLYALDKLTGSVIWSIKNLEAGVNPDSWNLYGDRLYYGSEKLYIVDVEAGKTLYSFKSPNKSSKYPQTSFRHAVAVDVENKKMYATDDYFLMCMELPE